MAALGLTGVGSQALAATATAAPTVTRAVASPDFTCPSSTLCLFQGTNLTGYVCEFPMPADKNAWISLRPCGLAIPWGALNDQTGSRAIFEDAQTGLQYCEPAGYRGNPSSAVRNTGYIYIQYGVTSC